VFAAAGEAQAVTAVLIDGDRWLEFQVEELGKWEMGKLGLCATEAERVAEEARELAGEVPF